MIESDGLEGLLLAQRRHPGGSLLFSSFNGEVEEGGSLRSRRAIPFFMRLLLESRWLVAFFQRIARTG